MNVEIIFSKKIKKKEPNSRFSHLKSVKVIKFK